MVAWESASGTRISLFMACVAAPLLFSQLNCTSTHKDVPPTKSEAEDPDASLFLNRKDLVDREAGTDLLHPKKPDKLITKFIVMTAHTPPRKDMEECRQDMRTLADNAINPEMMLSTTQKVADVVRNSRPYYHWCFYYSMVVIDNQLEEDGFGVLLEEQSLNFSKAMKAQWILAVALDQASGSQRYFNYLRTRYQQISREYFAREVIIVAPPFGVPRPKAPDMIKPAGAADVDL